MKSSFLLVELIISILLIFGTIIALYEIRDNNLHLLKRNELTALSNSAVNITALHSLNLEQSSDIIYVQDIVNKNDDKLRELFQNRRIEFQKEDVQSQSVTFNNQTREIIFSQSSFSDQDGLNKKIITIKLQ